MKNNKIKVDKKILIITAVIVATILMIVVNGIKKEEYDTKEPSLKPIEIKRPPEKMAPVAEKDLDDENAKKQEQSALDLEYTQQVKEFYEAYPMFEFLPVETEDYRIVYSVEKNKYRIRIKKPENEVSEQQKQQIIESALQALKNAGETEEIQYYVLYEETEEFN